MAPVVRALKAEPALQIRVCVTAQHREMLDQVLRLFDITPDHDLNVMRPDQGLAGLTSAVLSGVSSVLRMERPDRVLVHGDTTTTLAASLAAYYERIPVAHVEAGLRTRNIYSPWPEEINRRVAGVIADLHFAPTERAKQALLDEVTPEDSIIVTGNTVIDALLYVKRRLDLDPELCRSVDEDLPRLSPERRLVLVTGHRRESFGDGFEQICLALSDLAARGDLEIIYPVHLNPNVQEPVRRILSRAPHVHLIEPLDYLPFVRMMSRSYLIITDSGGVQEEAPSLGKPVLVMRDTTERPEAVEAGTVLLVGSNRERIRTEAERLLDDAEAHAAMSAAHNPYGDGRAAERIVRVLQAQDVGRREAAVA